MSDLAVELEHRAGSLHLQASLTMKVHRAALFGPSGVGKSTLLRILAGLLRPERGRLLHNGRTMLDTEAGVNLPPQQRGIGLLPQGTALFPHLSVEENLRFGLRRLPAHERQRRVDELAAMLGLEPLRQRTPGRLSGGERQRVALARALAPRPDLLLLDEPFSALDGKQKDALWETLDPYLSEHGISTLLVSHDAGEVWAYSDAVIRMESGTVSACGPPSSMLSQERQRALRLFGAS